MNYHTNSGSKNPLKYHQLISTAEELFMRYGVRRVTVEEICKTAQVSKMTFYKYFANKTDLAKQLVEKLLNEGEAAMKTIIDKRLPFTEKVEQFIELKLTLGKRYSEEFIAELMGTMPDLHLYWMERSQTMRDQFLREVSKAQNENEVRKEIRPEFISYIQDHLIELFKDPVLKKMYTEPLDLIRELTQFYFYGIMARDKD